MRALLCLVVLLLLAWPSGAALGDESLQALEQLLGEHPMPGEQPSSAPLPEWLSVSLTAPEPPVLGEPFAVTATLAAVLAPLPDARFAWKLPKATRLLSGAAVGQVALQKGASVTMSWALRFDSPLSIVEGQMALDVTARLPRQALFQRTRQMPAAAAAVLEAEVRRQGDNPRTVSTPLEVAVNAFEGFVGFSPLVWGAYTAGDGFHLGAGSFMDTNFTAQDLVGDAEKRLLEGNPREALLLLERARSDLGPGVEMDVLLSWESLNCEAIALFLTGDRARARQLWEQAATNPAFADVRRYCWYNLGEACRVEGQSAAARSFYELALRAKPSFRLPARKLALLGRGK